MLILVQEQDLPDVALACEAFGCYLEVIDKQGLSPIERQKRADRMEALCVAVLHDTMNSLDGPPARIFGIPTRIWFALCANLNSRQLYLYCFPDKLFKDRYASQYFCEGLFSAVVLVLGYKPSAPMVMAILNRIERLSQFQNDPFRPFYFVPSSREFYPHSQTSMNADAAAILQQLRIDCEEGKDPDGLQ